MIKNLIEKTKKKASEVSKPYQKPQISFGNDKFPSFEELAPRNFESITTDIWKYSMDELYDTLQKYENYIGTIKASYNEVISFFGPMLTKFDLIEKERKRINDQLTEKENYILDLEQNLKEIQTDIENEIREKELARYELEQIKKEKQILESQINWNNDQIHKDDGKDAAFLDDDDEDDKTLEKDLQSVVNQGHGHEVQNCQKDDYKEQFLQRINILTQEVQQQLTLNKDSLQKIQTLQNELQKQNKMNKEFSSENKNLLQQLVEIQSKHRTELHNAQLQNQGLTSQIKLIENQLLNEKQKEQLLIQKDLQLRELNDKINDLQQEIKTKQDQIQEFQGQIEEQIQTKKQLEQIIMQMQHKRETAINEIKQLNDKLEGNQSQQQQQTKYTISLDQIKKIRIQVQHQLIQMRKNFEGMYKNFITIVSQVYDKKEKIGNELVQQLMKFEANINEMIIKMQDLVDEIEDTLTF